MSEGQSCTKNLCVRCLLCNEKICYNREQTELLINHVRVFHPYIEVARLKSTDSHDNLYQSNSLEEIKNDDLMITKNSHKKGSVDQKIKRNEQRRTKRQDWKPGKGKLLCKSCGTKGEPVIQKKSSNMKFDGTLGKTCFLLWCWPFSYLSLMCNNETLDLYCLKCNSYIGTYDYRTESVVDPTAPKTNHNTKQPHKICLSNSAPNITLKALQCHDNENKNDES